MEMNIEMAEGTFRFRLEKTKAVLTGCEIRSGALSIPGEVSGVPVTDIDKKAFWGQRNLKRVILPESIQNLGDWAFASCRNLEEVEFLDEHVVLGKQVFQNCPKLRRIARPGIHEDVIWLLGAVPKYMPELYLMDMKDSERDSWLERWDAALVRRLAESDEEGFADQFMCGLENFGHQDNHMYKEERRREKCELSYLRLLHPYGLPEELRGKIQGYLLEHSKGGASEAAWKVLLENHGTDMDYVRLYRGLFDEAGTAFHLDEHLKDIGEDFPELKAYLLRGDKEESAGDGFFDALSLDV